MNALHLALERRVSSNKSHELRENCLLNCTIKQSHSLILCWRWWNSLIGDNQFDVDLCSLLKFHSQPRFVESDERTECGFFLAVEARDIFPSEKRFSDLKKVSLSTPTKRKYLHTLFLFSRCSRES